MDDHGERHRGDQKHRHADQGGVPFDEAPERIASNPWRSPSCVRSALRHETVGGTQKGTFIGLGCRDLVHDLPAEQYDRAITGQGNLGQLGGE